MSNNFFTICSLFYIILLNVVYFRKNRADNYETKIYSALVVVSLLTNIFAITNYFTIINSDTIPALNMVISKLLLVCFIAWAFFFTSYNYIVSAKRIKGEKKYANIKKAFIFIVPISYLVIALLPVEFYNVNKVIYTFGPAANFVYVMSFLFVITCCYYLLKNKNFKNKKYLPLYLYLIFGSLVIVVQKMYPGLLLITSMQVFVTFLMYFTIENPDVKMIKQLEVAKEQADKANHAKSEFLSSMSHEIRTPLNAIMGFSNGLLEEEINDAAKSDVKNIIMASENLLELVNGILDISKIEANKLEIIETPYNFKDMFDELVLLTKARLGDKPLDFKYSYDKNIPEYLYGDAIRLKQVIINLLTNAVKYTNSGYMMLNISGKIKEDKVKLVITVQDSGIGIKKENIDKLFSKFDRLGVEKETSVEGTGLGLAITKKLVELMHGNINVQSEYGSGSKFIIRVDQNILKGKELEDAKNKKPVQTEQIIDAHGKKVLVVDDNLLNIKVAERLLAKYNVTIESVMSGQECLDKVNTDKYDLILLDDMMPKMTGGETFVKLKEKEGFNTPVVILTANAITGMREKYLSDGFDDYLAKPIEQLELNRVIKKYLS